LHNMKKIPIKNEYGNTDITAFNAINKMENPSYKIIIEGKKYLGQQKHYLSKTEVLKKAGELLNKTIHRNTFLSWEKQGLISKGFKKGKDKLYPPETPFEIRANWLLMHGPFSCSPAMVKEVRMNYLEALQSGTIDEILGAFGTITLDEENPEIDYEKMKNPKIGNPINVLTYIWLRYKLLSVAGFDPLDNSKLIMACKNAKPSGERYYDYRIFIE
jgi:hypothetical protein